MLVLGTMPWVLVGPAHGAGGCPSGRYGLEARLQPDHTPPQTGQLEPLLSRFTEEEELQMTRMLQRMDILAKVEDPERAQRGGCLAYRTPVEPPSPPAPLRKLPRWACG